MKEYKVILFDGVCNLCNSSVNYIIDHDKHDKFRFASLQSEAGQKLLKKFGLDPDDLFSIILIDGNKYYSESSAIIHISKEFGGVWKTLSIFKIVPPPLRNFFYRIIAKNRYKWFGKKDSCRVPTHELKEKFLG
ncbi:MAG: thiol-disulfide oxidoreductase DCC family protein [bacterium]|nr:thiol-disulfide oxidoreductase DCC family protein [bacterium]